MTNLIKNYDFEIEEQESSLIRVEMNCIEYPLFSKYKNLEMNSKVLYMFNKSKNMYLEIQPGYENRVPGEFDERVFYGILAIYQKSGYTENTVYTDFSALIKCMGVTYNGMNRKMVKESLNRLNSTIYIFNNCFYSNRIAGIKNEMVRTNMFNITYLEFSEELSEFDKGRFRNSKIKEIIKIKFSDEFYNNIISKGFLRFDSTILLKLRDGVARDIYKLMTKWRNKKPFISVSSKRIASRIPLSFTKTNIPKSIQRIEQAFKTLIQEGLLKGYQLIKKDKLENSIFEFFFDEEHNFDYYCDVPRMKRLRLEDNPVKEIKADEPVEIVEVVERRKEHNLRELIEILPEKIKMINYEKTKWIEILRKKIEKYDYENIKHDIRYSAKEADDFERFFFKCVASGHWGAEHYKREEMKNSFKMELEREKIEKENFEKEKMKGYENSKKEIDEIYNGYSDFEKNEIFFSAVEKMRRDGNRRVSEKVDRILFNTSYKYKVMKERLESSKN